jgi:2-polyprenyl-3-methyl-5-hydroxy-6-metoxy-1,4-benzoquinol methylase
MRKNYVDKEINEYFDSSASERLFLNNDKKFLDKENGIIEVTKDRWLEAQYYEKSTWDRHAHIEDMPNRNFEHVVCFDNYDVLESLFKKDNISIIELGCGPFTQITHMLNRFNRFENINIDLLDPLINHYSTLKNCVYKNKKLLNKIDVNLLNSSIEDYEFDKTYDLVIMMNVLEHCFNIDSIFEKIDKMLNKDGIFVFFDCCTKNDMIEEVVDNRYDCGHPIRITEKKLDEYLSKYDNRIFFKQYENRHNQEWRIDKYCIFKK